MSALNKLLILCFGLVIIAAFIPVFVAVNAENDLIRIVVEIISRLFAW
jgi:hypothetical protein